LGLGFEGEDLRDAGEVEAGARNVVILGIRSMSRLL
jgi:hypothetical protein